MAVLDTTYKRKSAVITAVIVLLIIFIVFNFGLRYFDPPLEYGISVNFGTTDFGSGNIQPKEALTPVQQKEEVLEEKEVSKEVPEESLPEEVKEVKSEEVLTQENEEAIAIKKQEEKKKKALAEEKVKKERERIEKERIEREKKAAEEKKQKEQEAKRKQLDALMGEINTKGKATGGEGDDKTPGDKGRKNGDPSAKWYIEGGGSGGNYWLENRKAKTLPEPDDNCNEEGWVVVKIWVNRNGKVIKAKPGEKGTTNPSSCLKQSAIRSALQTKFSPDANAPAIQTGLIKYYFSFSNKQD